jgi:hypothetical protein
MITPVGVMALGNVPMEPGGSNVVKVPRGGAEGVLLKFRTPSFMPALSNRADAKSTPTLMNMFRRIFVFIRCLWFV